MIKIAPQRRWPTRRLQRTGWRPMGPASWGGGSWPAGRPDKMHDLKHFHVAYFHGDSVTVLPGALCILIADSGNRVKKRFQGRFHVAYFHGETLPARRKLGVEFAKIGRPLVGNRAAFWSRKWCPRSCAFSRYCCQKGLTNVALVVLHTFVTNPYMSPL